MLALLSSLIFSKQLIAESWSADKTYDSGDIVEFDGKYYLASYWSQGMQPIDNQVAWDGWISIKEKQLAQWKVHKKYKAGSVVIFNEKNYIAKWWNRGTPPETEHSPWVKLALGIGEEAAPDDRYNVLGKDKDGNGIRDSYERFVEKTYQDPIIKSYLKTSAREYQKVLELDVNAKLAESLTTEQAEIILNNLVTFLYCNRKLRKEGRLPLNSSPISEYYNTIERAISRHKGGRILYKKNIEESFNPYNEPDACGSLIQGEKL